MRKMHSCWVFLLISLLTPLLASGASDSCGAASLAALPVASQSSVSAVMPDRTKQLAKLLASDGLANDRLGWSADISGSTAVLGAPFWPDWGIQGRALVFVKPASGWANMTQTATLMASDGAGGDYFGAGVSISGNVVVVGSPWSDGQGAAYVFVKPANGWADMTETAKLTASDAVGGAQLGQTVSIYGETIVLGAPNSVAAYVFVKPANGWANMKETAKLTPSDAPTGYSGGNGVSISGKTVVVGAPGANQSQGAAYVFVKPANGWANMKETAKLIASDGKAGDYFGWALDVSGDTVAVGAFNASVGSHQNQGAAYIFVKPAKGWKTTSKFNAKLTASDGATTDQLGFGVATNGNTVLAGAPGFNSYQGAAYIFVKPAKGWKTTSKFNEKLTASDGVVGDYFGFSPSIGNGKMLVGAACVNNCGGAAYVFGK